MTGAEVLAAALVAFIVLGFVVIIVASLIVGNENARYPWFCPVCGEDYPCAVHGEIE